MVFSITFPPYLTEEEEALQSKYQSLRKKKRQLQAIRNAKKAGTEKEKKATSPVKKVGQKREDDIEHIKPDMATDIAKRLVQKGIMKIRKREKGTEGFKRARTLEKRLLETEKSEKSSADKKSDSESSPEKQPNIGEGRKVAEGGSVKNLYSNFVRSSRTNPDASSVSGPSVTQFPRKGKTVYVSGLGDRIQQDIIEKAFKGLGTITNITVEPSKNCGFVTFERSECADQAICELNGSMASGVQLKVQMARRQPGDMYQGHADESTRMWASNVESKRKVSTSSSPQKRAREERELVIYNDEDNIF